MRGENRTCRPPVDPHLVHCTQGNGSQAAEAKRVLLEQLDWLIDRHVKSVRLRPDQREDARHNGIVALLAAGEKFDPDRGIPFEAIAQRRVRDAVINTVRPPKSAADVTVVPILDMDPHDDDWQAAFDSAEQGSANDAVRRFVDSLSPVQRAVVRDVYWHGRSQADVARARGISRAAVTKILNRVHRAGRLALADFAPDGSPHLMVAA